MRTPAVTLLIAAALLGGCTDPYTEQSASEPETPLEEAQRTGEYPGDAEPEPPGPEQALGDTPAAAIEAFARTYTNWEASTLAGNFEKLAEAAVGQAAKDMSLAAQRSRSDYELQRGKIFNRGSVRSISVDREDPKRYVVVTLERSGSDSGAYDGLRPAFHVTVAKVQQVADGWTVSSWQPMS